MIGSRGENATEDETSQPSNTNEGKNVIGGDESERERRPGQKGKGEKGGET